MKLLTNFPNSSHINPIRELIPDSNTIFIAVAFLKLSGLVKVLDDIKSALRKGCNIKFICGLDFGLTEPQALTILYDLSKDFNNFSIYVNSNSNNKAVFHPKVYFFIHQDVAYLIVGSANLTEGGIEQNYECSIFTSISKLDKIFIDTKDYFANLTDECEPLSLLTLLNYKAYYDSQVLLQNRLKAKPNLDKNYSSDYHNLKIWLEEYKKVNDINAIFDDKSKGYDQAEVVLNTIADTDKLSKEQFIPLFERLVQKKDGRRLWHSGSIYRKKNQVFNHIKQFQGLVRYIRSHKNESPSHLFSTAIDLVSKVGGSGVNTVTEIMMTYNRRKFANLNENPIKVLMDEAGVVIKKHRNSFNGHDYELYCSLVSEITESLGLRNMLEADSLFNNIYWTTKTKSNKRL